MIGRVVRHHSDALLRLKSRADVEVCLGRCLLERPAPDPENKVAHEAGRILLQELRAAFLRQHRTR